MIIVADILRFGGKAKLLSVRQRIWYIAALVVVPVVTKVSWSRFTALTAAPDRWEVSSKITQETLLELFRLQGPGYWYETIFRYFRALFNQPINLTSIQFSVVACVALAVVARVLIVRKTRDTLWKKRQGSALTLVIVGFLIYIVSLLVMYLFTYTKAEALGLASYDRYLATYVLGMALFILYLGLDLIKDREMVLRFKTSHVFAVLLVGMLLVVNWLSLAKVTVIAPLSTKVTREERAGNDVITRVFPYLDEGDGVFIIDQRGEVIDRRKFGFMLVPHYYTNTTELDLGPPLRKLEEADKAAYLAEAEETLRDEKWVYLHQMDEQITEIYAPLFEDAGSIQARALYRVDAAGEDVKLRLEAVFEE